MAVYLLVAVLLTVVYLVGHHRSPQLPSTLPRLQRSSKIPFRLQWSYLTDCRQLFLEAYQTVCTSSL